jgi:alkaline phosphatase
MIGRKMKFSAKTVLANIGIVLLAVTLAVPAAWARSGGVKNVIVLVPDGCNASVQTLARWYKGQGLWETEGSLALDRINTGVVSTYMADSIITDSAPAATAFATGYKSSDKFLSVAPRLDTLLSIFPPEGQGLDPYMPLATVLEGAKLRNKSVGLVATSEVSHATPAAFACHVHARSLAFDIMEQMAYEDLDVCFGGGKAQLIARPDGEDLLAVLLDRGYRFANNRTEMEALSNGPAWGLFADSHMAPHIDRDSAVEPSLAEMTAKAIQLLSRNRKGFFLMVEGSQVDWAGHANDPIYMVTDFLAFDDAVKVALDFAKADGNTLVLAFPDHNTGGLSLGNASTNNTYTKIKVEDLIDPLVGMTRTAAYIAGTITDPTNDGEIEAQIETYWTSIDVTPADVTEIKAKAASGLYLDYAIAEVISKNHTVLGWTTHGHAGEDVPLWSYGPNKLVGRVDNTELARATADALGVNLGWTQDRLFVECDDMFPGECVLDTVTDPANPVLNVRDAQLPINKNLLIKSGRTRELEGIVVYAPKTGKVYIPFQAYLCIASGTCF